MPAHPPISLRQSANATSIAANSEEPNYIYLALYMDGVYRQRCQAHLHQPKAKLVMIATKAPVAIRYTCPQCAWLQHIARFLPTEEETQHASHDAT